VGPICQPDIQHFSPLSPHQARRPPFTLYPRRIYPSPYLTPRLRWIFELAQAPRRARKARRPCSHRLERPYRHLLACKREMSEVADGRWCLRLFPPVCECGYVKKPLYAGRCELASHKISLCSSWMRRRVHKKFLGPTTRDSSAATFKKFTCTGAGRKDLRTLCGLEREIIEIRILSPRRGLSAFACGTCSLF